MTMLEQALRSSVFHLVAERRRLEEEVMDMERRAATTAGIEGAERMKRTTAMTNTDLTTERDRIDAEAERLVSQVDALLAKDAERSAGLRRQRDEVDAKFQIGQRQAEDTAERNRLAARQEVIDEILQAEENRLAAIEQAERGLYACITGMRSAIEAGAVARGASRALSGGQWSSWAEVDLTNRLSALFATAMLQSFGGRAGFGLHCKFAPPPYMDARAAEGDPTWREKEEKKMSAIIGNVMAEIRR